MKPSVCIVTCYRQPDYVRAVSLRQGLRDSGLFERVIVIKNRHTNVRRYAEVLVALLRVRFTQNPDVYVLTFRGYELLPLMLLIGLGKKVIYDELVNPVEWFVYEHKKFGARSLPAKLLRAAYRWMGRRSAAILADTASHADYSAELMGLPLDTYRTIPVSTDEALFASVTPRPHDGFNVIYYGSMLPLHGIDYVIEAALRLADNPSVQFHLIGGKQALADKVADAVKQGAHIRYDSWIPYEQLPDVVATSDLCLGGPFGGTLQAQFVVTGKTYQFMAAGRPVVVGENKESHMFADKQTALIVPQGDSAALAEAITWATAHPNELAAIGERGRQLYQAEYSNQRVASDLRRLFTDNHIFDMKAGRDDEQNRQKDDVEGTV